MCEKFTRFTKEIISESKFMEIFRKNKKDFTRKRKVSFMMNILLVFACLKRSIQAGIDQFLIDMDTEFDTYSKHQHKRALALTSRKFVRLVFGLLVKNQLYIGEKLDTEYNISSN